MAETPTWGDTLDFVEKMRRRYYDSLQEPILGRRENPYVVYVPQWYEDECTKQGTTPQQVADGMFSVAVRVEVVAHG